LETIAVEIQVKLLEALMATVREEQRNYQLFRRNADTETLRKYWDERVQEMERLWAIFQKTRNRLKRSYEHRMYLISEEIKKIGFRENENE